MSITLELSPELETQIEQAATRRGTNMETFLIEAAQRALHEGEVVNLVTPETSQPTTAAKEKRREAISQGFGFLKGRVSSSDDFLSQKHAEAQSEREKDEARAYGVRMQDL